MADFSQRCFHPALSPIVLRQYRSNMCCLYFIQALLQVSYQELRCCLICLLRWCVDSYGQGSQSPFSPTSQKQAGICPSLFCFYHLLFYLHSIICFYFIYYFIMEFFQTNEYLINELCLNVWIVLSVNNFISTITPSRACVWWTAHTYLRSVITDAPSCFAGQTTVPWVRVTSSVRVIQASHGTARH